MLKSREIHFTLDNGVFRYSKGESQQIGKLLDDIPIMIYDTSPHYEDFEPGNLIKLQEYWNVSSPTENIKED